MDRSRTFKKAPAKSGTLLASPVPILEQRPTRTSVASSDLSFEPPPPKVTFDQGRLAMLEPGMEITLPLTTGATPSTYMVIDHAMLEGGTVRKRLVGLDDPRAEGMIVIQDGAVAGWLRGMHEGELKSFRIRPSIKGQASVVRIDDGIRRVVGSAALERRNDRNPQGDGRGGVASAEGLRQRQGADCEDCDGEYVDVMFFYTSELLDTLQLELEAQGFPAEQARAIARINIQAEISLQTTTTNGVIESSGLDDRLVRLIDYELDWDESGGNLLSRFSSGSGPIGSEVRLVREALGADLCVLMSATSGVADDPDDVFGDALPWDGNADSAFSFMVYDRIDSTTFPYLLGLNMGLGGVAEQPEETDCEAEGHVCWNEEAPDKPDCPLRGACCEPIASGTADHAWRFVVPAFGYSCVRTMMAGAGGGGAQGLFYSNPEVSYFGVATGNTPNPDDPGRWADNASVLSANLAVASGFRCSQPLQGPIDGLSSSQQQLLPGGLTSFDGFGTAVASNGTYIFVSAPGQGGEASESGAVVQFTNRGTTESPDWRRNRRFAPATAGVNGGFGTSIAADREWLVVGSPRTALLDEMGDVILDPEGNPAIPELGAVFVYRDLNFEGAGDPDYCLHSIIQPEAIDEQPGDIRRQSGSEFGASVDVAADLVIVGQPGYTNPDADDEDGTNVGRAWLFGYRPDGGSDEVGGFEPVDAKRCPADFNGDGIVDGSDFGALLIEWEGSCGPGCRFDLNGDGIINGGDLGAFLTLWGDCPDEAEIGLVANERFGDAVAVSPPDPNQIFQTVLVGAPRSVNEEGVEAGRAEVYLVFRDNSGGFQAAFLASLDSPWPTEQVARFGTALTAFADSFAVGAPGAETSGRVSVYQAGIDEEGNPSIVQIQDLRGEIDGGASELQTAGFGSALDSFVGLPYDGDKIDAVVVGSPGWDKPLGSASSLVDLGTALVFGRPTWSEEGTEFVLVDRVDDGMSAAGDRLASTVALVGASAVVGSPLQNQYGFLAGAAFVQAIEYNDCNENGIEDSIEIYTGQASDTNNDGFPDECILGDCDADLNGDGIVDGTDLGDLIVAWGPCPVCPDPAEPECPELCPGDLNLDGVVDGDDLGDLFLSWGLDDCPILP